MTIDEYKYITDTINSILGPEVQIFLFGSRAKGNHRQFSDVDIAIDSGYKIASLLMAKIKNTLDESSYPYKVDIIDLNSIGDEFKNVIKGDLIKLIK